MHERNIWKRLGKALVLGVGAAIAFSALTLALPLTEKIFPNFQNDLHFKNNYQKITYTLDTDETDIDRLNYGRNILYDRLRKLGIEEFYIGKPTTMSTTTESTATTTAIATSSTPNSATTSTSTNGVATTTREYSQFTVTVQTTRATTSISQILDSSNDVRLMTAKEGVNLDDEKNQFASMLPENYNSSEFGTGFFRSVVVSKMKQQDGTYSYYAFFKIWPTDTLRFSNFIKANVGKNIGIYMDGYVIKYKIESADQTDLTLNVGTDEAQAKAKDIIFNSGTVPFSITVSNTEEGTPDDISFDYLKAMISFGVVTLMIATLVFLRTKRFSKAVRYVLTLVLLLSLWIALYKVFAIEIDAFVFVMGGLISTMLIYSAVVMGERFKIISIVATIIMIFALLIGVGIVAEIARNLAFLTLGSVICDTAVKIFFNNIKTI